MLAMANSENRTTIRFDIFSSKFFVFNLNGKTRGVWNGYLIGNLQLEEISMLQEGVSA
jgi:hypothetical protein